MKKNSVCGLLLILVLLAGCNYPGRATDNSGAVNTQVAVLLTQLPTSTMEIAPTATPTLLQPSTVPQVTTTSTSAPSATSTVLPTATANQSDPALTLGDPTWTNPSDWNGFYLDDSDSHIHITQSNNNLVLTALSPSGWHGWSMTYQKVQNLYLEGTFSVATCSGTDRYGLIFRAPDTSKGYFFGVTCDGQYSLRTWESGGFDKTDLIAWTKSDQIQAGSNQTNKLGVKAEGSHYMLYVNGALVGQVDDSVYQNSGYFGAFISSSSTTNLTVTLSDLRYWQLP